MVTGDPDPNVTGNYFLAEPWEDVPTYKHETLVLYIWLRDGCAYVISDIVGDMGNEDYFISEGSIEGPYEGHGAFDGTCIATPYGA